MVFLRQSVCVMVVLAISLGLFIIRTQSAERQQVSAGQGSWFKASGVLGLRHAKQ